MSADSRTGDSAPTSISRYRIVERLASGPEGEVYRAFDPMIERPVAVKLLHLTFGDPTREAHIKNVFYREMQRAGRLIHPLITTLFDAGEVSQGLFVATEFVDGPNVAQLVADSPGMDLPSRMTLVGQLVDAIQYAHRSGVTHLNLKPTNLLVAPELTLKVAGFGLTHVLDAYQHEEQAFPFWLSPYTAPERIRGEEGTASADIYSLAAVVLEILTGVPPFVGAPEQLLERIEQHGPTRPAPLAELGFDDSAWSDVFLRAMSKDPGDRFPTASAFLAALASVPGVIRPGAFRIWTRSTRVAIAGLNSGQVRHMDSAAPQDGYTPGDSEDHGSGEPATWSETVQDATESLPHEELRWESEAHPDFETTALAQKIAIQTGVATPGDPPPAAACDAGDAVPPLPGKDTAATNAPAAAAASKKSPPSRPASRRWIAAAAAIVLVVLAGAAAGLGYRWLKHREQQSALENGSSAGVADGPKDEIPAESAAPIEATGLPDATEPAVTQEPELAPTDVPPATPAGASGVLRVVTTPAGATVAIDGSVRGTSPLRLRNLTLAEHLVAVSLDGFEPEEQRVRLTGRKVAQVVELALRPVHVAPTTGSVAIATDPPGARILIDGQLAGESPRSMADLSVGRHSIRAELDGHEPATREVEIAAGERAEVSVHLVPIAVAPAGPMELARVEVKPRQTAGGAAPGYPRAARAVKLSGSVTASWVVDEEGAVIDAKIQQSTSKVFENEVLHWLEGLRYVPGRQAGQPVKVRVQRRFTFEYAREH